MLLPPASVENPNPQGSYVPAKLVLRFCNLMFVRRPSRFSDTLKSQRCLMHTHPLCLSNRGTQSTPPKTENTKLWSSRILPLGIRKQRIARPTNDAARVPYRSYARTLRVDGLSCSLPSNKNALRPLTLTRLRAEAPSPIQL